MQTIGHAWSSVVSIKPLYNRWCCRPRTCAIIPATREFRFQTIQHGEKPHRGYVWFDECCRGLVLVAVFTHVGL